MVGAQRQAFTNCEDIRRFVVGLTHSYSYEAFETNFSRSFHDSFMSRLYDLAFSLRALGITRLRKQTYLTGRRTSDKRSTNDTFDDGRELNLV